MSELEAADALARERALDVSDSFIVQAPAGSGKTTVLTQRYLRLLTTVDEPEQVLAITFTRKAAGEMRERVQKALEGDIENRSPADALTLELAAAVRAHGAQRAWGLEDSAARLRIQTIDAFNGYLANSLPITSRNGFGRTIADAPDDLYAAAARETLRDAENDPDLRKDFELILRRLDDSWQRLELLIAGMLPKRAEWLPNLPQLSGEALVPKIEASLAAIVSEELAQAAASIPASFVEQASALARFAAQHVDAVELPDVASWRDNTLALTSALEDLARWRGIKHLTLTEKGTARARLTKNEGIPADNSLGKRLRDDWLQRLVIIDPDLLAALGAIGSLPDPIVSEKDRGALEALARLLLLAATQLTRLFNVHGECDHVEIAGAARRALTENSSPTPLAERIGTRLMHILVDEFQDTSRDQYELLRTLTQDWSPGDGRTLFLVGDPMQSIYGFRNAEVGRFSTVRAAGLAGLPLIPLELRRNFRSAPALVHWCNDVFARVFPTADDVRKGAVRHLASVAARTNLSGEPRLYRVEGDCGRQAEADHAADLIAGLKLTRPAETIAVLAGARSHLRAIRESLEKRGVPFIGVKLEPLADVPVVRDLEALVRALDSPLDRVAWLAVLRAPFVGLGLADLTVVSESAGEGSILSALIDGIHGLSPDGMERLLRAKPLLLAAWQERERESRAQMVERTWLGLGGASAARAGELAHARRFLAALDDEDGKRLRGRQLDLDRLMGRLYAEDPALPDAVSLMTIHGAKGLEFDHVFVVGVGLRGRADDPRLLNWLEVPREQGGDHLVMAPIRYRGDEEDPGDDAINLYLKQLHRERSRAERARQAYVALTRARRSLHLFVHPRVKETDGALDFGADSNSLLHSLWPAIGADAASFHALGGDADSAEDVAPAATQTRQRLRRQPAPLEPPADVRAQGQILPSIADQDEIEFSWARQTARRVGTVVHEALERFGRAGLPPADELPRMRARLESRLQALGIEKQAAKDGAEFALKALSATLADTRGRWLFDPGHTQAESELALSGVRGADIINAVIDRTFVDAEGTRWVVDFKTSPHEGGDRENFLDEEVKRYSAQLTRYVYLARQLGPQPVRAGLYYPLLAAWREVDVG
ncbi:MAG TPA: UvrD-helicase domain-containing protein [Steroidobacteraceae bacterium]|nr:UvrD-helicase domain-containing protein [Steroidobacteraceae bacterium]